MSTNPLLYPNVTSLSGLPGQVGGAGGANSREIDRLNRQQELKPGEFAKELDTELLKKSAAVPGGELSKLDAPGASPIKPLLKFSSHASSRLRERKIELDTATMTKISDAVDKADAKGVQDTLVLTGNAALIVNVPNRTVVTAMDRGQLTGNVFTNIDGAVIV
jgi:flagellar operon protein